MILIAVNLLAQDPPAKTTTSEAPKSETVSKPADVKPVVVKPSLDDQMALLRAQHAADVAGTKAQALQTRWTNIQVEMSSITQEWQKAQPEAANTTKAFQELIQKVYKNSGVTEDKFTLNTDSMEFVPKASPAPPAADKK
jgi:hypothetical protein